MEKKFRLKECVLGTYELVEGDVLYACKYDYHPKLKMIDTSICYNNDYMIGESSTGNYYKPFSGKIISKIPPQMINEYEFMVSNHLRSLNRSSIDIMLIHNSRSNWTDLAIKLNEDDRIIEVGVSNFSIDQIKEYKDIIGEYPLYNEMEINPNYYDKELIDFCHENGIKIIAYAILGGKYNADENIRYYTLPYLLEFAGYHAEYIIIRNDSVRRVSEAVEYCYQNIIDKEARDPKIYDIELSELKKSINPVSKYRYPKFIYGIRINENLPYLVTYTNRVPSLDNKSYTEWTPRVYESINFGEKIDFMMVNDLPNETNIPSNVLMEGEIPEYEFITDYRVYFRYKLREYIMKTENPRQVFEDYIDDILVISSNPRGTESNINRYVLGVYLFDNKEGKLSKIKNEDSSLIIKIYKLN